MVRILTACSVTAVLAVTLTLLLERRGVLVNVAEAETLVPSCPQAHYFADGNVGPLFCVIDNPLALRFYASVGKRTFALGPNADPEQVYKALIDDTYKSHATVPELCAVYQLATWKNHWRFGPPIVGGLSERLNLPLDWCDDEKLRAAEAVER